MATRKTPAAFSLSRLLRYLTGTIAACFLAAGCLNFSQLRQPPLEIQYYTLEYAPPMVETAAGEKASVVKIKSFTAAPLYDTVSIIYRKKAFQTGEYVYHKWHLRPAEALAQMLTRDMRNSGKFLAVFGPGSAAHTAAYNLEGEVETFLEDDIDKKWRAVLALRITLCDATEPDMDKQIVFQKKYGADRQCRRNNPAALAEAMSAAMKDVSAQIIADVYQAIDRREKKMR